MFNRLYEELDSIGGSIVVVLDEIDNLGRSDDLLYALPRARSTGKLENVRVSVIGISNDFDYVSNLSPTVKSTLYEKEIEFAPYDADQLRSILTRRVDVAFEDETVEEGATALCAAYAAQEKGSARQAIRILYEAGEVALSDGDDTVAESHVEVAHTTLERERIEEGIQNITPQDRLVLTAVALLEAEEETPSRTKHVYERYSRLCDALSIDGLHQQSVRDHLQDLAMQGILDTDRRQGGLQGGDYLVFSLNTSLQITVNVLSESERYQNHGIDEVLSVAMQR